MAVRIAQGRGAAGPPAAASATPTGRLEAAPGLLVTRVEAQGLLEVLDGGPHVTAQEERRAEIVVGGRVARAHAHLLLEQDDRLVELAVLEEEIAELGPGLPGLDEPPLPREHPGQVLLPLLPFGGELQGGPCLPLRVG